MIETIFTLLTSGAGGGLLGGIFGLFKQREERKERLAVAELNLKRDEMEYAHERSMLDAQLQQTQLEAEKEIEVANQRAVNTAQRSFANLSTTSGIDNFRASVRPVLAYWAITAFTVMLAWAFAEYVHMISQDEGLKILLGMFATLNFTVTSVVTFYYVARRNNAPS